MAEVQSYSAGALAVNGEYAFINPYDLIKPEKDGRLIRPFGRQYSMMIEYLGETVPSNDLSYDHYYRERVKSKVKATTAGGAVDSEVTFTLHADAINSYTYDQTPSQTSGTTAGVKGYPVRVQDVLMILPSSGIAADNMIYATVTDVTPSTNTFKAVAHNGDAIPAIASAQEIVVLYAQMGEGGKIPAAKSFTTAKLTNSMITHGHRAEETNIAGDLGFWVEEGVSWSIDGVDEHTQQFMADREMKLMLGNAITNTTLSNWYGNNSYGALHSGSGLFPEIWSRGHSFGYSGLTGPDLDWAKNITFQLNKHKGARANMLNVGMNLRSDIQDFMNDYFQDGAVSFGLFTGDQEKFVSFDWSRFELNGYHFTLNTLEVMNDLQGLGAADFPFPYEGFLQPDRNVTRAKSMTENEVGPPVRIRILKRGKTHMQINFFDGASMSDEGVQTQQMRYRDTSGIEGFAFNQWAWLPRL